jgi:hypothetical protein
VAQPWTESAPVDFGDFGTAGARSAIDAQKQFAEQSKNFSDLLTTNIDNVNKNKNTLQAVELIKSLDVDSSKDLFKSGNLANSISTMMGTNHISFGSEVFTTALSDKYKDIKDNDQANMDSLLAKPENYKLLAEDPEVLKAMDNSLLSTSEIQKSQKQGKIAYTTHLANKLGNDPLNMTKSPLDLKQEILNNYGDVIDETTLNNIDLGSILSNSKKNINNATTQTFQDDITVSTTAGQNADGTLKNPFLQTKLDHAIAAYINNGDPEGAKKAELAEQQAMEYVIAKDDKRRDLRSKLQVDFDAQNKALDANVSKQFEDLMPYAKDLAYSLANEVTNERVNENIDQYVDSLPVDTSKKNLLKIAYNQYKNTLNVSPSTFHKLLMDQGIFYQNYDPKEQLDDFLIDIQGNPSIQRVATYSHELPAIIRDVKSTYMSNKEGLKKEFKRNLRDIANTAQYLPKTTSPDLHKALYSQVSNAWGERTSQLNDFAQQINTADAYTELPTPYNDNFEDRVEYGLNHTAPYVDSSVTNSVGPFAAGLLSFVLGKKLWKGARNIFSKTPVEKVSNIPGFITGAGVTSAGYAGYEPLMNWWYGKERYAYDPKKMGKALVDIENRFAKGTMTQQDVDFINKHSKYSRSLGPDLAKKFHRLKQEIINLNSALKAKK